MISRGLLISVGVTLLAVGLLFVYFRNKVTGIEKKVELMFNLIQNYEGQQNAMQEQYMTPPQTSQDESYPQPSVQNLKSELIEVSDDEDGDSDEVSDSEDESDDEEETLKFEATNIELKDDEVKTIQLEELNNQTKEEDSLDEDDSEEEEEEEEEEGENISPPEKEEELEAEVIIELTEDDYKKKTVPALKQIASERGLQNYRSLKKAPLIELLMSQ